MTTRRDAAGVLLVDMLNSVVRKHKKKFQKNRELPAAPSKPAVTGGVGVGFGATKISP